MFRAWYGSFVPTETVDIGARIKEAREATGMSQLAFAKALRIGERTVQAWEGNTRTPRLGMLELVAEKTNRPVSWFYEPVEAQAA